jgi:hypothetical protein
MTAVDSLVVGITITIIVFVGYAILIWRMNKIRRMNK